MYIIKNRAHHNNLLNFRVLHWVLFMEIHVLKKCNRLFQNYCLFKVDKCKIIEKITRLNGLNL